MSTSLTGRGHARTLVDVGMSPVILNKERREKFSILYGECEAWSVAVSFAPAPRGETRIRWNQRHPRRRKQNQF